MGTHRYVSSAYSDKEPTHPDAETCLLRSLRDNASTADAADLMKALQKNRLARRGNFGLRLWNRTMAYVESQVLFHKTLWELRRRKLLRKSSMRGHYTLTGEGQKVSLRLGF